MIFPTADAITNSFSLLFIAVVLCLYQRDGALHFRSYCFALCSEYYVGAGEDYMLDYCFILYFSFYLKTTDKKDESISIASRAMCFYVYVVVAYEDSHIAVAPNRVSLAGDSRS